MTAKKPTTSRRTFVRGTAATAAIAPFFIGRSAKAAMEPELTIKFATVAPTGTPWEKLASRFKKHVKKVSEGRIKVKSYMGGALGGEAETAAACKAGRIGGWGGSMGAMGSIVPELSCLELPYLFGSSKKAQKALQANRKLLHDLLWDRGFKLVMFAENGFRSLGTTFPVEKPSDLKGKKIRTQESKVHIDTFKGLGASPVPMGITEVLSALQTGVVEGYDNTKLFAFAAALYMSTTHWTETKHIYQPAAIVLSRKGAWDKMPTELQEALALESEAVMKMEDRGFRTVRALGPQLKQNFLDVGIEMHEPDLAAFRKVAGKVHKKFEGRTTKQGKALLKAIKAAL
jgi:TRAP-type C4-dicarboxylate transport system substrate-binding protein